MVRRVVETDIPKILKLYKEIFNINITTQTYQYWYYNKKYGEYDSFVYDREGEILGHNALIRNEYNIFGESVLLALSSGGMVKPESSGIFYKILKDSFTICDADTIIAFPNKNSLGFFKRIFNFEEIKQTYFSTPRKINKVEKFLPVKVRRSNNFIRWRINSNPINKYSITSDENNIIVTKNYQNTELDILYSNKFESYFINFVNDNIDNYDRINIIHWDKKFMKTLGFEVNDKYSSFVLKGNMKIDDFQFQMIDSDVF